MDKLPSSDLDQEFSESEVKRLSHEIELICNHEILSHVLGALAWVYSKSVAVYIKNFDFDPDLFIDYLFNNQKELIIKFCNQIQIQREEEETEDNNNEQ